MSASSSSALNSAQAAAVAHVSGPILVFAGAGSGKTRVITHRIANLVRTQGVPPYRILAVTFTNKAAGEMRERLISLLGSAVAADTWVGTFHAVCARLLRRYHEAAGLTKDFLIYDDGDQRAVVSRVLKELGYDDRRYPPRLMLGRIMKAKQEGQRPEDVDPESYIDDAVRQVFAGYENYLRAANAVDFEDLLSRVTHIAEDMQSLAGEELRGRFDHVLVDEFQDTNRIQYRLVSAIAARTRNLCAVGDDDQSIYRWRGGDVRLIRGFKKDFADALVVKLEENYRSTGHIVQGALGVIRPSREREPKELFTSKDNGDRLRVVSLRNEREEASYVVARVKEALAEGVAATQLAVFYRIHAMSRVVEEVFRLENVPYRIIGGTRFFDRAEVKDLLSYLRLALNPRSDVDFLRAVNTPARGIGQTTLERLIRHATGRGTSLFDALDSLDTVKELSGAPKKKLLTFRALIDGFRTFGAEQTPHALARHVLTETGYLAMLEAENTAEADARRENLDEFLASLMEYEESIQAEGETPSLAGYLERVTLASSPDEQKALPSVSLMTVHGAKGLEYERVYLLGMEEQIFPYQRGGDDGEMDEEEERRLAYVAITRARQQLYMFHTATRTLFGNTRAGAPSRFLDDLPAAAVERIKTYDELTPVPPAYGRSAFPFRGSFRSSPGGGSRYPDQASRRAPGERYVERDPEYPQHAAVEGGELSLGVRVKHKRFGEGLVESVQPGVDPSVTVRFPGWGEKKVLVRFLELA